jgi:hypothetical protein
MMSQRAEMSPAERARQVRKTCGSNDTVDKTDTAVPSTAIAVPSIPPSFVSPGNGPTVPTDAAAPRKSHMSTQERHTMFDATAACFYRRLQKNSNKGLFKNYCCE